MTDMSDEIKPDPAFFELFDEHVQTLISEAVADFPTSNSQVFRSKPVHGSSRTSNVLGSMNNPWTQDVTTDADAPIVEYEVILSAQAAGDDLLYGALVCDGVIVDRIGFYTAGAGNRENRGVLSGSHTPGDGDHTYEIYMSTNSGAQIVLSSVVDVNPAAAPTANGVSSMKLTVGS